MQVTLAAHLAERGRSKGALATIEQVRALFTESDGLGRPVPGALLQIDWIRACALSGEGRIEEARALMTAVRSAAQTESPKDMAFVPTRRYVLLVRAAACARDHEAMTRTMSRELDDPPLGSRALVMIQPSFAGPVFDKATLDQARAQVPPGPAWRILPARYRPALAHWSTR